MDFIKIQQIDNVKGITSPHVRDIRDIGKNKLAVFRKLTKNDLQKISEKTGGYIEENMELGEEWAFTKEFFNGVKVHVLYLYYGDEFGVGKEDEIQILFSGNYVRMLSGEDLCHFSEILTNFMELIALDKKATKIYPGKPSDLLNSAIKERTEPFFTYNSAIKKRYKDMIEFTGCKINFKGNFFRLSYKPFPELKIEFFTSQLGKLDFLFDGSLLKRIHVYDSERLVIMIINHCLRFIKTIFGKKSPRICNLMFSGLYKNNNPGIFQ
ncbi:MAG: hypothetical protein ACTSWY_16075 [Promethearchaeota archaeon]